MTRDQIVRLGQGGRPWQFLPIGFKALGLAPEDVVLRLLVAANLAKLGLRTPATEQLDSLPDVAAQEQAVRDLRVACARLADDSVSIDSAVALCRANLKTLQASAPDRIHGCSLQMLLDRFERWRCELPSSQWFRTLDGNIVRRRSGQWHLFADHRGAAERFAQQHLRQRTGGPRQPLSALYALEGMCPPWMLLQLASHTPRQPEGFWPRVAVVQADLDEFLDGLAHCDLGEVLSQERVEFYIGPQAAAQLAVQLNRRDESQISGPYIPLPSTRQSAAPPIPEMLEQAQQRQLEEHRWLLAEVESLYAERDRAWWRKRIAAARAPDDPLRVLIPTCRYSTYVQHSSRDLAESLADMGLESRILIEPDDSTRMSSLAYLRAIRDFRPDLIVLINYFRANLGDWFPRNIPYVCWIQDDLPHMYDASIGAAQGELDFIAGHLHRDLFQRFGFPRARTLAFPVVVSSTKFHDCPVSPDLRRRHECEIALVSHHSEPPRQMHQRLLRETPDATLARIFESLYPRVVAIGEDPLDAATHAPSQDQRDQTSRLVEAVSIAAREVLNSPPDERMHLAILRQYALPLTERILRHQTVQWACEIAQRRGWRFHLYGRGWERTEPFAAYAHGEAARGEELRAIYQCAGVNLHIAATALVHQRVLECALSGGLPVCRLTVEGLTRAAADIPLERRPDWVYPDLAEMSFDSSQRLESLVAETVGQPERRSALSSLMARRVRERLTNEVLIERILDLVCS